MLISRNGVAAFAAAALLCATSLEAAAQDSPSAALLPNPQLRTFLAEQAERTGRPADRVISLRVQQLPQDSLFSAAAAAEPGGLEQPFAAATSLILLLDPSTPPAEVGALLEQYDLASIDDERNERLSLIGAVVVDASAALAGADPLAQGDLAAASDFARTPLAQLANRLQSDPRILAATPDTVKTPNILRSAARASVPSPMAGAAASSQGASAEDTDWGIADAHFNEFWPQAGNPAITVGVIDVGFAEHEDLKTVPGLPDPFDPDDHGNHVAGIMCAQHNGKGVVGAIPNCTVKISAGTRHLSNVSPIENSGIVGFYVLFSESIASVLDFIEKNPDVRTINLSLGYNWLPNFALDPREANAGDIRDLIRAQGRFFASVLAVAKTRGVIIVSAAGNDSSTLATPLPAMWASPFNFGSMLVEDLDGWTNGLVVQAHNRFGQRAPFSNVDAHVSCPGVDVLSALAISASSYGELSGTSMASPYCAAAVETLRVAAPNATPRQVVSCVRTSTQSVDGTPRLDLRAAIAACQ